MVTAILGREINGIFSVLVIEKRDDAYRGRQAKGIKTALTIFRLMLLFVLFL